MSATVSFFLPTRKGSQRVKEKNTKRFSDVEGGILELKLNQLMESKNIQQIVLSTNDERCIEIGLSIDPGQEHIKIIERPEQLCLDSTPLQALIDYVPQIINSDHIIWGHATTPFVTAKKYDDALDIYFDKLAEGYDSLVSVLPLRNFLLRPDNGSIFNYDQSQGRWPRTQDLPLLYEVNHAMFIASRDIYVSSHDRIGSKPFLMEQNRIDSFDIDWEDDFLIAESIYDKLFKV